jgi:DNA processing protein
MEYAVIPATDPSYPRKLTAVLAGAPLHMMGNMDLLRKRAIGICGSRNASESALKWAYEFGREAGQHGIVVVSGYARGVDRQALEGVLAAGGATIAVLAEGMQHFRLMKQFRPLVDLHRNFLAISMFEPRAPWTPWRAMERNKLIVGLSIGLFVIEARQRGGTINAAQEAVRQRKRLWAVAYSKDAPGREGNRKLLATSAIPLKHTADLKRALEEAMTHPPPEVEQLVMSLVGDVDR